MDMATLHGGYMNSRGFSSREAAVPSSWTWDRGVGGCPTRRRTGESRLMAAAYLPHKSFHATGDHHAVLGVSRFATKQEIKKSYRRLALELHPDVCSGDHCSTRFQQVKRAYEVTLFSSLLISPLPPAPPNFFMSYVHFKLAMAPENH